MPTAADPSADASGSDGDLVIELVEPADGTVAAEGTEVVGRPIDSHRIRSAIRFSLERTWLGTLRTYWGLQGGRWWEWTLIWILQNIRFAPVYIIPLLTALLIDQIDTGTEDEVFATLPLVLLATLGLCIGTVISETGAKLLVSRIGRNLTASMRRAILHQLNRLELSFHDKSRIGVLQNKFTLDMGRLEGLQTFLSESLLMYGTVTCVMLGIIAWTHPLLLLVIVLAVPVHLILARLFWKTIDRLNHEYRGAESSFMANLHQALTGLRMVRAHANEEFTEKRVAKAANTVARKAIRLDLMTNLFGSGSWAVSTLLHMGVVAFGVWLAVGETRTIHVFSHTWTILSITLGQFTVLMSYYGIISGALGSILGGMPAISAANDGLRSLSLLYRQDQDRGGTGTREILGPLVGDIHLRDVVFRYPSATEPCLRGLTIDIPAGSSLALVGPSGSGKSTVANLILGFYPIESGSITVDGKNLVGIDHRSLRRQAGVVSQDVVLFNASILTNIAWGDPHPDPERAREAARRAQALAFIEQLPEGFATMLGDGGGGLSGGQRQRLAIARALYRDPRLLILDEATSALDPESEHLVAKALNELRRDRTTLIIAHRLSTVRKVDQIAVIDGGRVVESGTFDDLIARKGPFHELARSQLAPDHDATGEMP